MVQVLQRPAHSWPQRSCWQHPSGHLSGLFTTAARLLQATCVRVRGGG